MVGPPRGAASPVNAFSRFPTRRARRGDTTPTSTSAVNSLFQPEAADVSAHGTGSACWRAWLRRLTTEQVPFNEMTPRLMATLLERHGTACHAPLTADQMLALMEDGGGELVATRTALAFTVHHGEERGIELRYLLVMPKDRGRGAGRALIAKIRARYAGQSVFCTFSDSHWVRFARLVGFEPRLQGDGSWHVTSDVAPLGDKEQFRFELAAAVETERAPEQQPAEGRVRRLVKATCASAAVALATVSCIES